jgi:putative flippase GtrA
VNTGQIQSLYDAHRQEIVRFAGYVAVSGSALCVDVAVYWTMLGFAKFAFVAAGAGYVCGVLFHYILSSRIVFRDLFDKRGVVQEAPTLAKFYAAGLSGLVVTACVVGVLADIMGVHPLLAKVAAAGCSFVVVFLSLRFFVFNPPAPASKLAA